MRAGKKAERSKGSGSLLYRTISLPLEIVKSQVKPPPCGGCFGLSQVRFGEGNGNPLQYSCLEDPMDRGTWQAMVHEVTESDTTEATKHARTS